MLVSVSSSEVAVSRLLDLAPLLAAALAIPQFLPQLIKVRRSGDASGVSLSWAVLTSVNNAAWLVYFTLSGLWTALVPAVSATVLAGLLASSIRRQVPIERRWAAAIAGWALLLVAATVAAGRAGLGTLLSVAFAVQVAPAIWVAYRSPRLSGVAVGTWLLVAGELTCWGVYGVHRHDPRLVTMGVIGVIAAALMLTRVHFTRLGSGSDNGGTPMPVTIDTATQRFETGAVSV
jgi:uncharacterized protein with PQ loop repeat